MYTVISPNGVSTHSNEFSAYKALRDAVYSIGDADIAEAELIASTCAYRVGELSYLGQVLIVPMTDNCVAIIKHTTTN